jgi:integrase
MRTLEKRLGAFPKNGPTLWFTFKAVRTKRENGSMKPNGAESLFPNASKLQLRSILRSIQNREQIMANLRAWIEPTEKGFRVRYRDAQGKKQTAGYGDKAYCRGLKKKTQDDLAMGLLGLADKTLDAAECFEQFIQEYSQEHEENTIATVRGDVKPLLARASKMVHLTPEFMKSYKCDLIEGKGFAKPLARATVYRYLGSAKTWLKWAERNKIITWNPFQNVINPQPKSTARFLSDLEIARLDEACSDRLRPIFRLGWMAGLRQGEAFDALGEDLTCLEDGSGMLRLRDTKNGTDRVVPLEPDVMSVVGSQRPGKLFPGWSYTVLKREWNKAKKKAGIDGKCPFHATRHTFAKKYMERGGQETALMRIMGHASLQMISKVYGHFAMATLARSMRGIADGIPLKKVGNVIEFRP